MIIVLYLKSIEFSNQLYDTSFVCLSFPMYFEIIGNLYFNKSFPWCKIISEALQIQSSKLHPHFGSL